MAEKHITDAFDPYRKWLGIPQRDQPPHHYRLLGIELFESDPDVIVNAADGRMAQVKNFQAGKRSDDSQRILNEIAAAKVCLLNPGKKAEYDRRLQQRLSTQRGTKVEDTAAAADAVVGVSQSALNIDSPSSAIDYSDIATYTPSTRKSLSGRKKKARGIPWQIWAAIWTLGILVTCLLAYLLMTGDRPSRAAAKTSGAERPVSEIVAGEADKTSAARTTAMKPAALSNANETKFPADTANDLAKLPRKQPAAVPKKTAGDKVPEVASAEPTPKETAEPVGKKPERGDESRDVKAMLLEKNPTKTPELAAPKKLPVPDDPRQVAAEKNIREIFQKEFSAAHSAEGRMKLAAILFDQGTKTADDPVARFVLWRLASTEAAGAEQITAAFDYVDQTAEHYQIDGLSTKADLLAAAAKALRAGAAGSAASRQWADTSLKLVDAAIQEDKFEIAAHFLNSAGIIGQKTRDADLNREVTVRTHEVDRQRVKFAAVQKALAALQEDSSNAEANLAVGEWECFFKGNWREGLPSLTKGSRADLASVAKLDLAQPSDPLEQMALADAWWSLVKKTTPADMATAVQAHAAGWYTKALPNLPSLEKKRVADRLDSLKAGPVGPLDKPLLGGTVKPGNVALATNGTKVVNERGESLGQLIDGITTNYGPNSGTHAGNPPCEWTLTFAEQYRLREIRILLYDADQRTENYKVLVSADGQKFVPLVNRGEGDWSGWQKIAFPARPVKAVKLLGLRSSINWFSVVEIEAYCIPPVPERGR